MRGTLLVVMLVWAAGAAAEPLWLESLDGKPASLALREEDKALVVHFWATWCPECVEELPLLAKAASDCAGVGVRIVTVNVGEDREVVLRFLDRHELGLSVLRDSRGRTWRSLGAMGLPTNLTWTRSGRRTDVGPRDRASWSKALAALGCRGSGPEPASHPLHLRDSRRIPSGVASN